MARMGHDSERWRRSTSTRRGRHGSGLLIDQGVCASAGSVAIVGDPGCLQLDEPAGGVVHLTDGQAEPVPEKPQPLMAGPLDQFFGVLYLVFGGVRACHGSFPSDPLSAASLVRAGICGPLSACRLARTGGVTGQ